MSTGELVIGGVNPGSIITDADQANLMALDDMLKLSYFAIGDIANKYIDQAPAVQNGVVITHREIYRAVGYFCGRRSERTIRGYAEIARLFPAEVRAAYDELPFSHFIEARRRGNGWRG